MNIRTNSFKFGLTLAILLPLISLLLLYLFKYESYQYLMGMPDVRKEIIIKSLSMSMIPNLLLFFGFMQAHADNSGKGVVTVTLAYCAIIFAAYTFL